MNYYAVIPARGGSKRLPRKNVALLNKKPLIAYTIEAATSSKRLSRLIVSTDDEEIASVSKRFGAEVPFQRPLELSRDGSAVIDVINHAVSHFERQDGDRIDSVVLLQPTSPFRTSKHIDEAIALYESSEADTVTSVRQLSEHPYWSWTIQGADFQPYFSKEHMSMGRENLPPAFIENGAIFIIKRSVIDNNSIYGQKIVPYLMDRKSSIDIDTLDDFLFAEFLLERESHGAQTNDLHKIEQGR